VTLVASRRGLAKSSHLTMTRAVAVVAVASLGASGGARAEGARSYVEGDRHGVIVPLGATRLRVARASLVLAVARDLDRAAATASFDVTSSGEGIESVEVAFVSVRGPDGADAGDPATAVEVDGVPVAVRASSDAEILGPKLRAWVAAHEAVASELRAANGPDTRAGAPCDHGCPSLGAWLRGERVPLRDSPRDAGTDEADDRAADDHLLVQAAREAIPEDVARVVDPWTGTNEEAPVRFVVFRLEVKPHEPRTVTVHYDHRAAIDRGAHVRSTFRFEEIVAPARAWAGFGPMDLTVRVPSRVRVTTTAGELQQVGETYRATIPALADGGRGVPAGGAIRVDVLPMDGLWLGMTEPRGYWAIVIAAFATIVTLVGAAAPATWPAAPGRAGPWARRIGAASVTLVCNFAALTLLLVAFPEHALGFGYRAIGAGLMAALLSGIVAAAASGLLRRPRASRAEEAPPFP
jgi:hypothetical protein